MKLSKDLRTIYLFAIISSLLLIIGWGVIWSPDDSYITAWDNYSNGIIDAMRTPVYPLFLGLLRLIFGEKLFGLSAVIIQHIVFLISVRFFYKTAQYITNSERVSFWLTLFYALMPSITSWNNIILTESFAISGSVFLLYLTIQLYQKVSPNTLILHTIMMITLLFLRPIFVYMLPVFAVFWTFAIIKKKFRVGLCGFSGVLISIVCLFSYMKVYEKEYGVFASSLVNTYNQSIISLQYGLFDLDAIENPELKADIIEYEQYGKDINYEQGWRFFGEYDLKTMSDAIRISQKNNAIKWVQSIFGRMYKSAQKSLFFTGLSGLSTFFDIIGISLNTLYLFLIIYLFIIILWVIRQVQLPPFTILLYLLGVSNIIVAIIGAQAEWDRLILPSMPIYLLMFGQICTMFKTRPFNELELR